MGQALEVRLLGPFEAFTHGTPAAVGGARRRAVLAMLALHDGRVVPVEQLVQGLWGDHPPGDPRNAVHHHVARLRAALGEAAIVGTAEGYALPHAAVDAVRFEQLLALTRGALRDGDLRTADTASAEATGLWRGAALSGLPDTEWFDAQAGRLEALRVDALEERFEVAIALGDHRDLAPAIRSAVAGNPFRERLWGQLILVLYRSGRQADALETYQEARRVLDDELGIEPGPELRRLHEAVLAHDPSVDVSAVVRVDDTHLPAPTTSFVGREQERADVSARLHEHRLVTLVGPPGVGKSRLALETARSLRRDHPDGTWWVDLTRADGAGDAAAVLAAAVGVRGPSPLERVVSRLRYLDGLVVLDGCEHVLVGAVRLAAELLAACPQVRVLATSRQSLHLPGEVAVVVHPLERSGIQLFVDRARAARPGFEADPSALATVERVVRRLDGMPLAIELAAARVGALGLEELLTVVDRRTALLEDLPDHDPARGALTALLEWSYEALSDEERTVLDQLAVHRGGGSLSSIAAMAATHGLGEANVALLLGALVGRSVVVASFTAEAARYELLGAVREHAIGRMAARDALGPVRAAHAAWFATLADVAGAGLRQADWLTWRDRLELERDNLWAALTCAREMGQSLVAARLGIGLGLWFGVAGRVSEGRAYLQAACAAAHDAPVGMRVELLALVCYLATEEDDLDAAVEAGQRGLTLATSAGTAPQTALAHLALAFTHDRAGSYEQAMALAGEARRRFDELGDRWGVASAALFGALGALGRGDLVTAGALTADAVQLHGDHDVVAIPARLLQASLAERGGDPDAAAAAYRDALARSRRVGFADHASFALTGLGSLAAGRSSVDEAKELFGQAIAVAAAGSAPWCLAHARVRLAALLHGAGDAQTAMSLYRDVIAWSEQARRREAREALFLTLAGSPVSAALLGLAELPDASVRAGSADGERRTRSELT